MTLLPSDFVASDREDGQLLHCARSCSPPPASPKLQLTLRAVLVGLFVGTILCFTNMYFGLQTGWVTMGSLQCAMVGFAILKYGGAAHFNPLENVVVQTVGVATATMPLAGGFVGIIPALQLLDPPVRLTVGEQLAWCAALTYFGIFFAVPLRRQTILVEKLPFPSGTATSKLIEMLHSAAGGRGGGRRQRRRGGGSGCPGGPSFGLSFGVALLNVVPPLVTSRSSRGSAHAGPSLLFPGKVHHGAALGALHARRRPRRWALLGPLWRGWVASVPYESGARVVRDAARRGGHHRLVGGRRRGGRVAMGSCSARPSSFGIACSGRGPRAASAAASRPSPGAISLTAPSTPRAPPPRPPPDSVEPTGILPIGRATSSADRRAKEARGARDRLEVAPPSELVPGAWWVGGLVLSVALCVAVLAPLFRIPAWQIGVSALLACLIAVLAVRALGQTDLNPVSAVGKLSQILFALLAPGHVVTNIVAGALAEAGAMQAGDLMQDLKTGRLLGASPRAQFLAQLVGSSASILVTVAAFNLYATAYGCRTSAWSCEQFRPAAC